MEENQTNNVPKTPDPRTVWATWSLILGGFGLISNCICAPIWSLPAGLYFGLGGIACAVLSKKGRPFTQQAQLGLILSVIAVICGLLMCGAIIFVYDIMDTDTVFGEYFRQWLDAPFQMPTGQFPLNGQAL
ncbi:MAG TPA: sodium:solute symporter [Candidatus Hungatella pullicola]|nr:sodium:solute symporter [Candidatus Hungatella pullicola]